MSLLTRVRYLNAKHGATVTVVLLVVGVCLLAVAGWVYVDSPTTEITDHTDRQTVTSTLGTSVTVTNDTSLYREGTVLEDQPVYLSAASPTLNLSVTTAASDGELESVSPRLSLVYTATRDGETFWTRTTPVATAPTPRPGGAVNASLPTSEIRTRLETYRNEFGRAATVDVALRLSVAYATDRYEGELTETSPVTFGDGWYAVAPETLTKTHSTPVTYTRTVPVTTQLRFVGPLGLGAAFALVGGGGFLARRRFDTDVSGLVDEVHHARYSEWVSEGELPTDGPASVVRMQSLEALVDVAIDSGKRVIHDPSTGTYAVLDGTVQYRYTSGVGEWRWES